jgi:HEAT repeat protein
MSAKKSLRVAKAIAKLGGKSAFYSASKHEREVTAELARVRALAIDDNVVGLIQMLDSDVRGRSESRIVRDHAASRLGRLGDPRAIPPLMKMLHDPEAQVRFGVIEALGRLKAKEAEDFLRETLDDPSPLLRIAAADALGHIGAVDAVPVLRKCVDSDPDPYVRLHAVESLVILGDQEARNRVPGALSAVERLSRESPRYRRLQDAAATGEALAPWTESWESDQRW